MIRRRELLGGTVLGGLLGGTPEANAAAGDPQDRMDFSGVVRALDELRSTLRTNRDFPEIAQVRDAQKQFLRQQGKLPDFIEVGIDIWFDAYDWHIRNQLLPTLGRDAAGRYTIALMDTVLIMRPDFPQARYVGPPFDNR